MSSSKPLFIIFEQIKLIGPNYFDWLQKIIFVSKKIAHLLDKAPPKEDVADISPDYMTNLEKLWDHDFQVESYDGFSVCRRGLRKWWMHVTFTYTSKSFMVAKLVL